MIPSAMYQTIWKDYRRRFYTNNPRLPEERSFSVGRALWALSRHRGLKFVELASKTGITESSLLRMSCSHKLTSTMERVNVLCRALGVKTDEFFQSAREEFFGNFFITKSAALSPDHAKEYAKEGIFLHQQIVTPYPDSKSPDFKTIVYTPPVESLVDLFSASFFISSGKELGKLRLPVPIDIHLCVVNGLIEICAETGERSGELRPGQSVHFDGSVEHAIRNLSDAREAEILVSFTPTYILSLPNQKSQKYAVKTRLLDIPGLIDRLRERISSSFYNPMSLSDLALQAGLEARGLDLLSKGNITNLPIERLERLAELAHVPMEALLTETPFQRNPFFKITKGVNRGIHDYRSQYGVRFFPWVRMGVEDRKLFLGEVSFEPPFPTADLSHAGPSNAELKEKVWEGNIWGYLMAKGLGGKVEAHIGKRHIYPDIDREDTVYLDMSLGFSFRNFSPAEQTSLFLVSSPPLF